MITLKKTKKIPRLRKKFPEIFFSRFQTTKLFDLFKRRAVDLAAAVSVMMCSFFPVHTNVFNIPRIFLHKIIFANFFCDFCFGKGGGQQQNNMNWMLPYLMSQQQTNNAARQEAGAGGAGGGGGGAGGGGGMDMMTMMMVSSIPCSLQFHPLFPSVLSLVCLYPGLV